MSITVSGGATPKPMFAPLSKAKFNWANVHLFWAIPCHHCDIHRGLGHDAHTASLFPREPLIDDCRNLAADVYVERFHQWRVTILPAVLAAARHTLMLSAYDN